MGPFGLAHTFAEVCRRMRCFAIMATMFAKDAVIIASRDLGLPVLVAFCCLLDGLPVTAQNVSAPPQDSIDTIRTVIKLVQVDVVVTDKKGRPVLDLRPEDFQLFDEGKQQHITAFELLRPPEVGEENNKSGPNSPLPSNTFSNRPEYRMPEGPPTVILLDLLNTPMTDQVRSRKLVMNYLSTQLHDHQRVAVYVLGRRLIRLLDFTSDPKIMHEALNKLRQESSPVDRETSSAGLANDFVTMVDLLNDSSGGVEMVSAVEALRLIEQEWQMRSVKNRVEKTVWAFGEIVRSLEGVAGRKLLVWISGAFPLTFQVASEGQLPRSFQSFSEQLESVAKRLTGARIAVYPVDARGLMPFPLDDIGDRRRMQAFYTRLFSTHSAMKSLAEGTGGLAFYNRNDIDGAVDRSFSDGSTYYTLSYYPDHKNWDGTFREIKVKIDRKRIRYRYRRGYYAIARDQPRLLDIQASFDEGNSGEEELNGALQSFSNAYQVQFTARVNFRESLSGSISLQAVLGVETLLCPDIGGGERRCSVSILVGIFSPDGQLMVNRGHRLRFDLTTEEYSVALKSGLSDRFDLEIPPGRYRLRLVVRDDFTGALGSADFPLVVEECGDVPQE